MTKRCVAVLYILGVLIMLNSCGNKEIATAKDEFSSPERTYRLWLETAEKGDISNNTRCVTEASKRIIDSQMRNMDDFMSKLNENVKIFKTYTMIEQKIKEDKAMMILKGRKGDIMAIPLKKEAEGWKIDLMTLFGG